MLTKVTHNHAGNRLVELGSTLLDLGRSQSQLCGTTADTVIENTQRSLTQLKDYNNTKKKLESRRDNYFTLCTKTQKKNTDDTRLDTELRNAKVKYEESITETRKKAREIEATDDQSLLDLERFIEALVEHHTSCIAALSHITGANTTSNGSSSALVKELEMRGGQASTWPRRERGSSSFSRDLRLEIEPPQPSPARPLVRATTTLPDKRRPISPQLRRPSDIRRVTDLGPQRGKRHTRRTVFMRADHNYDADSSAELSLRVGDIIRVISSQHCQSSSEDSSNSDTDGMTDAERNGWCMGESTLSKRKGLFPAGYCSIVATPDPVALDIPKLPKAAKPLRLVSGSSTPTGTILDRTARGVEELNPFDATFEQSQATHSSRSVSGDRVPMIGINGNTGSNSPRYRQAPAPPVPPLSRGTRPVKPRSLSQAT